MKKKVVRRKTAAPAKPAARKAEKKNFLFLIKSWMFVVMFALMLGIGAIVGTFINTQMNADNPQVAGVTIEAE